jgi:hypothetical protein
VHSVTTYPLNLNLIHQAGQGTLPISRERLLKSTAAYSVFLAATLFAVFPTLFFFAFVAAAG